MTDQELIQLAHKASENAYSPYSGFAIGAALLSKNGKVYLGCNIENASYGLTICAERVAIFNAISQGEKDFVAMAILTPSEDINLGTPCGACRQVIWEFARDIRLILCNYKGDSRITNIKELLPQAFSF